MAQKRVSKSSHQNFWWCAKLQSWSTFKVLKCALLIQIWSKGKHGPKMHIRTIWKWTVMPFWHMIIKWIKNAFAIVAFNFAFKLQFWSTFKSLKCAFLIQIWSQCRLGPNVHIRTIWKWTETTIWHVIKEWIKNAFLMHISTKTYTLPLEEMVWGWVKLGRKVLKSSNLFNEPSLSSSKISLTSINHKTILSKPSRLTELNRGSPQVVKS